MLEGRPFPWRDYYCAHRHPLKGSGALAGTGRHHGGDLASSAGRGVLLRALKAKMGRYESWSLPSLNLTCGVQDIP